jgi:hypothetical protein
MLSPPRPRRGDGLRGARRVLRRRWSESMLASQLLLGGTAPGLGCGEEAKNTNAPQARGTRRSLPSSGRIW